MQTLHQLLAGCTHIMVDSRWRVFAQRSFAHALSKCAGRPYANKAADIAQHVGWSLDRCAVVDKSGTRLVVQFKIKKMWL